MPLKQSLKAFALRLVALVQRKSTLPLDSIKTFIILEHATALGTAVHATPLPFALRAAVPDAEIYVLTSGFGLEVFQANPAVTSDWFMPSPFRDFRGSVKSMRDFVRKHGLRDFAVLTPVGNERTAITLAAWLCGARTLIGHTLSPQLYRHGLSFDHSLSQIDNNLRIVEALDHPPPEHFEPRIYFDRADAEHARSLLPGRNTSRPLIAFVTQTSVTQRKSWRSERFIEVANFLTKTKSAEIVFVGTEGEAAAIESIRASIQGTTWNLAGRTDIQQLAALLSMCSAGVTLDTGTMHIGRAVGLPMVIIAPAWSPPLEWLPLGDARFVILKNADSERAAPDYVIDEVSVDEVTAALVDLLTRYPLGAS